MTHEDYIQRFPGGDDEVAHMRAHLEAMVESGDMERRGTGASAQYRPAAGRGRVRHWLTAEQVARSDDE